MSLTQIGYYATDDPRWFNTDELICIRYRQSADLLFSRQPQAEMTVEIYTKTPFQPQREEKMEFWYDGNLFLTAYIMDCVRTGSRYRLTLRPRTEFLQTKFLGAVHENAGLAAVLTDLLGDQAPWYDEKLLDKTVTGYLPPATRSQTLEQIAFGVGAMQVIDNDGRLVLKCPAKQQTVELEPKRVSKQPQIRLLPHYTRYELVSHRYYKGQTEKKLIDRQETMEEFLTFQNPHWCYNSSTGEGAEILDYGSNWVQIMRYGQTLTMYGNPWLCETKYHTLEGEPSWDPLYSRVLSVRDKTLIHPQNVEQRLQNLKALGQLRQQVQVRYLAQDLYAAPRVGDSVSLPGLWGVVTRQDLTVAKDMVHLELTVMCEET